MKHAFFSHIAVLLALALLMSMTGLAEVLPAEIGESVDAQSGEVTLDFVGETVEDIDSPSETGSELDMGIEPTSEGTEGEIELLFEEEAVGAVTSESDGAVIPKSLSLGVGETYALKAENAKYKTSKKSVATVDVKGVITAKKKGKAKITVKSGKKTLGVCNVTVLAAPDKVELSEGKLTLSASQTHQLKAVLPKKTASQIKWTSSKKKVATVDENGVVTAVGKGTAKITAKTFNGHKAVCKVTVNTDPLELSLPMKQLSVGVKEKVTIVPIVNEGAEAKFTWSVKKKSIATVNQKGVIAGKKVGSTKVTVSTQNGLKASMTVKVLSAPSKVTLSQTSATLEPEATLQLKAKLPKKTVSQIKWTSSKKKVATVDENGLVTAVAKGTANITASTYNGKKATCIVTVKGPGKPITAVTIRFDDVTAGDDVVVLPDEAVTASWSADGDVESYDYSILDAESKEIVSEKATQATSYKIEADLTAPGVVYTLKVGARPVGGKDEAVVWKSARFMRTEAEESDFVIVDGVVVGYTGPGGDIEIPATDAKGNAVTAIGEGAFKENVAITGATVSNGIVEIRALAFADSGLKEITLPKTITAIAEDAFKGCEPLAAHAPMGCYAYNWCVEHGLIQESDVTPAEYFKYETINGLYAKITGYTGEDSVVVIPSVIDDYTIQVIANNAFKKNDTIEYVTIPDTVIEIGSGVFEGCTSLVGVDVGKSVEKIGGGAFYGCTNLLGVDFPDTLKATGNYLFGNCTSLEYFDYPVNWEEANKNGKIIYNCPKVTEIIVPNGVKFIPNYAFANCPDLKRIVLPEGLEEVYHHAFSNCTGLTEMVYPSTIKTVGGINGCTEIKEIIIPDGATTIGTNAFESIPISTLTIPSSVIEIKNYAFYNCPNLETIVFNDGLETIGLHAFEKCANLTALPLPDSVASIGNYAFANCPNLSEFHYPKNWTTVTREGGLSFDDFGHHFDNDIKLKTIDIPDGATTIPRAAFAYATYLRNVTLPNTIITIGMEAFKECTAITNIEFKDGIHTIGFAAFEGCSNLSGINLPDSVSSIGCYAFAECKKAEFFHYPASWNSVTCSDSPYDGKYYLYWGHHFDGCTNLKSIEIQEGVVTIPAYAFHGAASLISVSFPESLKTIRFAAFEDCSGLTSIPLKDNIESIGCYAFAGCINLQEFHYPLAWKYTNKSSSPYHGKYYLDNGGCFAGCENLKTINIPEGVQSVPSYAFIGCTGLEIVNVPSTLQEIGKGAFKECPNLSKIYLGYNINAIGAEAFNNCPKLTIWTEYGSYALQYAKDNGIPYYYLSPDGVNSPSGTLYKGDSFAIYGYARASINLTNVTATIFNEAGNVVQTISVNPESTDYSMSGEINTSLLFGNLDLGNYRYTLKAKTNLSEESWVDNVFTIAPPPLRIYLSGYNLSNGIIDKNAVSSLSGTVISNYSITSLNITVYLSDGSNPYSKTVYPNTLSYDISNISGDIPIDKLPLGEYTIRITATSNGETRILADNTIQPVDIDGTVDEKTLNAVVGFVSNKNNLNLFKKEYVNNVLGDMSIEEIILMAINTRSEWIYGYASKLVSDVLTGGNGVNMYLVDLYENELMDVIEDMDPNTFTIEKLSSVEKFIADSVLTLETENFNAAKDGLMEQMVFATEDQRERYYEALKDEFSDLSNAIKRAKNVLKGVKFTTTFANNFARSITNYYTGVAMLEVAASSMNITGSAEFQTAVKNLRQKYKSKTYNVAINVLEQFTKDVVGKYSGDALKAMANIASDHAAFLNGSSLLSVINFCIDASMKLTGYEKVADDYLTFTIQVQAYETGIIAYQSAFNKVADGDTSTQSINRLLMSFAYAKQTGIRIHDTIQTLKNVSAANAKAAFDYSALLGKTKIV